MELPTQQDEKVPISVPVNDLVETIGIQSALALARTFGGRTLYIPTTGRLREPHAIVQLLGMDAARKLATAWPATEISVPNCAAHLKIIRDRNLRADRGRLTINELAGLYRISWRHVRRILSQ